MPLALAGALLAGQANAQVQPQEQPWLSDRRVGEGAGIRIGNFELHPGVGGEVGFDSNFFQSSGRETPAGSAVQIPGEYQPTTPDGTAYGQLGTFSEPSTGSFRLRVTPSLSLKTLGVQRTQPSESPPPTVALQAELSASYNEVIATNSRFENDVADRRYLAADASAGAEFLPGRPWGGFLRGQYVRAVQPVNDPSAPPGFNRQTFATEAAVSWRPGGGLMDWSLGYDFNYVMFEEEIFSAFTSVQHGVKLRGRWRFLPRTQLSYEGSYSNLSYPDGGRAKVAGQPLVSMLGLNGLVTNHFGFDGNIGWKTLFFDEQEDFDGLTGRAQVTWYPLPRPDLDPTAAAVGLSTISVGYRFDAQPAYLGNFVEIDEYYVDASYFIGGTTLINASAAWMQLERPLSVFNNLNVQTSGFTENRVRATLFGEYRTSDSFGINATLRYNGALTDWRLPLSADETRSPLPYDDLSFQRVEAWLGARWFL